MLQKVSEICYLRRNPSYFDLSWRQILLKNNTDVTFELELKQDSNPNIKLHQYIMENFSDSTCIFTDASQNLLTFRSAISFYISSAEIRYGVRVFSFHSILSLELMDISAAIQLFITYSLKNINILSDSKKSINLLSYSLYGRHISSVHIQSIVKLIDQYNCLGLGEVSFLWIPGNSGIIGNEIADNLAKISLEFPISHRNQIVYEDLKRLINDDYIFLE